MAIYKVIQDIESEDKLLGPLTLRQFIYAAVVIVLGFISFQLARTNFLLAIPFLPPMVFFGLLAAPFGRDQSSEVWLLARIRFFLKPRKRTWDQSGIQQLVTVTAPKKVEKHLTDGLSETEVKSRLQALATTIDSRGWAVKNVNVNLYGQPVYGVTQEGGSDRLVAAGSLPQAVPATEILASDDILDEANNTTAQNLDAMITRSEQTRRQSLVALTQGKPQPQTQSTNDYWFLNQPGATDIPQGYALPVVNPGSQSTTAIADNGAAEQQLLDRIHHDKSQPNPAYGHMRILDPRTGQAVQDDSSASAQAAVQTTDLPNPANLSLAKNDDLNIATLAHEAEKSQQPPEDEVVISLR